MIVGHAALAFALAAGIAHRLDIEPQRALLVGVVAGAFAVVPDMDMGYAFVGLVTAGTVDPSTLQQTFWDAGLQVHRGITHSLLVGGVAAAGFGLTAYRGRLQTLGSVILCSMLAVTALFLGPLELGVMISFLVAGVAVAAGGRRAGLTPQAVSGASLLGVLVHPFGDLFTGTAPTLLYPLPVRLLPKRVLLSGDPTLHLLAAFGLEVGTVWLAFLVYLRLRDQPLRIHIHRRAVLGAGYAAAVLAVPPPTLRVSYQFVYSVLAVGLLGISAEPLVPDIRSKETRRTVLLTALAAITVGWLSYTVAYVALVYAG